MKNFYKSKTIWVNLLFAILFGAQMYVETYIVSVELQTLVLAAVNLVLRFVTQEGIIAPKWFKS